MGLFGDIFDKKNVPNILTVSRGPIAGLIIWGSLSFWPIWSLLALFNIGAITDFLDGYFSRRFRAQTDFGKIFDPIFDKFLLWASYLSVWLLVHDPLLACLMIVMVIRECLTDGFKGYLYQRGIIIPALPLAKIKTVMQMMMIDAVLLQLMSGWRIFWPVAFVGAIFAVIFAYASGWQYFDLFRQKFKLERNRLALFIASCGLVGFWPLGGGLGVVLISAGIFSGLKWLLPAESGWQILWPVLFIALTSWLLIVGDLLDKKIEKQRNWLVIDRSLATLLAMWAFLILPDYDYLLLSSGLLVVILYGGFQGKLPKNLQRFNQGQMYIVDDLVVGGVAMLFSLAVKFLYGG